PNPLNLAAVLALGQAAELTQTATGKPQQSELPPHIQNLITSHINHVLQHMQNKETNVLTGSVNGSKGSKGSAAGSSAGTTPIPVPYPDLLPPLAHPSDVHAPATVDRPAAAPALQPGLQPVQAGRPPVKVINHQATGTVLRQGQPVMQQKVEHIMQPTDDKDVADKLSKLQQHVNKVMQQAEQHIPLAVQQAIRKRKEQQEQREQQEQKDEEQPTKAARSLAIPPKVSGIVNQVHANIPQLIALHREEIKQGKCSFQCPREALQICASNGKCVVNFPGQCELSQWNCFNTKNGKCPANAMIALRVSQFILGLVFHQVHDSECQNTIKCYQRDMM
ncbi:hypothetical protein KR018_006488, partial [Drosophila ironensis]